jgi:hypothetical protein
MEAYDQRYDVAVFATTERPEFLLYDNLFGDRRQNSHSLPQTTMETPFSKPQGHSKLNKCPVSTSTVLISRSGYLRMSSKLSLVLCQLSALSLPWYIFLSMYICVTNQCMRFVALNRVLGSPSSKFRTYMYFRGCSKGTDA